MNRSFHLTAALLLVSICFRPSWAQTPEGNSQDTVIREAIALFDRGLYDEAIAKLKPLLAEDPDNELARYELAFSYAAKGDNEQCRLTIEPLAAKPGVHQSAALALLGNCLDHLGKRAEAVEAYRRGLKISPDDAQLLFNLAMTLGQTGALDEARALAQNNVRKNPWHVSGHVLLAQIFEAQEFRVPAAFSYLRFLALEPSSSRSAEAAKRFRALMGLGVETTKKGANITIDSNSRTEEGNYMAMEMMLAMVTASETIEKNRRLSEFERARQGLVSVVTMFREMEEEGQTDFTSKVQRPFFAALEQEKLLDPFAGLALSTLQLQGTEQWLKKNAKEISRYRAWIAPQAKAGIPIAPPPHP